MNLLVQDTTCWRCGRRRELTIHHALPKYLKPKHNICIPLCKDCHEELNISHTSYILAFAVKLEYLVKKMSNMVRRHFAIKQTEKNINNSTNVTKQEVKQ